MGRPDHFSALIAHKRFLIKQTNKEKDEEMSERMNGKNNNLEIPVGKYKGYPIDILSDDDQYREWIISQKWFRDKFPKHYTFIINNFSEPSDTPEHNAMQVKFLDKIYLENFTKYSFSFFTPDSSFEKYEYKQLKIEDIDFEPICGGDIKIVISHDTNYLIRCNMIVELKPVIGDDYPSILRSIKRVKYGKKCILFKRFECEGATLDQVKATFGTCGILLIQESELPNE